MLNSLFSSFDFKNYLVLSIFILNFYFLLVFSLEKKINFFFMMNKYFMLFLKKNINNFFFFMALFSMIFFLNFFSMNFFMFNLTSQFSMNMIMIFVLWIPVLLLSLTKKKNSFLIHILPYGTNNILIPMMILIELMSFFIRPLTLFLRLSINMIAGHVLINLISMIILNSNLYFILVMYLYMMMKFLVSFIQAYIISTLLSLYIEEIYVKYKLLFN